MESESRPLAESRHSGISPVHSVVVSCREVYSVTSRTQRSPVLDRPASPQPAGYLPGNEQGNFTLFASAVPGGALSLAPRAMRSV